MNITMTPPAQSLGRLLDGLMPSHSELASTRIKQYDSGQP